MDGWMMDRRVDGGREGQTGGSERVGKWVEGGMASLAHRWLCAWVDRWMDQGRGGQREGWT